MRISDVIKKYIDDEYSFSLGHKMFNIPCEEIEENEIEQFILLRDIATIHLSIDISCFEIVPMWKPIEGKSTFSEEDVNDSILNEIKSIKIEELPIALQIKVLEIIFSKEKNKNIFDLLISKYYMVSNREINSNNWSAIKDCIIRGGNLCKMSKNNNELLNYRLLLKKHILELWNEKLYLPMILFAKIEHYVYDDSCDAIQSIDKILSLNSADKEVEFFQIDAYRAKYDILSELKKDEDLLKLCIQICNYVLKISKKYDKNNVQYGATIVNIIDTFFAKIVECCNKNKGNNVLRSLLNDLTKLKNEINSNIINHAYQYTYEINRKPMFDFLDKHFSALSYQELLGLIVIYTDFFQEQTVKNITLNRIRNNPLDSFWGKRLVERHTGLITCQIKPIDLKNIESNDSFNMHVHQELIYMAGKFGMHVTSPILEFISNKYKYCLDDFNFMVKDNIIIPEGKEALISKGFAFFLNGDFETSAYILVPQMEQIFRMILKYQGASIIKASVDEKYNADKFQTLTEILNNEVLVQSLEEYILFNFKVFLDLKSGYNIRNMLAHGLLYSEDANSPVTIYLLALIFKWIFLSSKSGQKLLFNNNLLKERIPLPSEIFEEDHKH